MIASEHTLKTTQTYSRQQSFTVDLVCGAFLAFLLTLALLFPSRVPSVDSVAMRLSMALVVHGGFIWLVRIMPEGQSRVILRIVDLAVLFAFLFDQMQYFQQLLFDSWLDASLLSIEYSLFGTDVTLAPQDFIHPILTEGMLFAYVAYFPLLPLIAYLAYRSGGEPALNDYLLNICLIFLVCYLGYIIYPIASPLHYSPEQYTVPLQGGLFTWCGEWIRHNQQYPGGSFPSAHCAAATGMLVMLYRYNRKVFFIALPAILILYVSTVYGRYHYLSDGIAGVLAALFVLRFSPLLVRWISLLWSRSRSVAAARKVVLEVNPSRVTGQQ